MTGPEVALGHNKIVSPSNVKVSGAGVLGAETEEYEPSFTSKRSWSFPFKISTVYGPLEKASDTSKTCFV